MSTMTIGGVTFTAPRNATQEAANFAAKQDESDKKDALAAANVGQAYVSRTKDGENKVKVSKEVRARAEELGVALPDRSWRGNRSSVAADAKKFNDAMAAAEQAEADAATETTTTDTTGTTDAFDINVGDGEAVEAANPADFNINAEMTDPIEADNTASTFDQVVTSSGNAADDSSTNTLMTGTFDDDYVAGTGETSAASAVVDQALALDNSTGAAEDEAIADYTAGTRGTIMTSPQGLLTDEGDVFSAANLEDDPFLRPNRSLGGGLLY